jgi:hypothetical protein
MVQVDAAVGWTENNQIALSCQRDECGLPCQELAHGSATLYSKVGGEMVRDDEWYDDFIPGFKHTYFYTIWNELKEEYGNVYRMRLMKLKYKECLSFHLDFYKRYHIPIITNDRSFLFINEANEIPWITDDIRVPGIVTYHLPAMGNMYLVDTLKYHAAYNGGNSDRIHLVFSTS